MKMEDVHLGNRLPERSPSRFTTVFPELKKIASSSREWTNSKATSSKQPPALSLLIRNGQDWALLGYVRKGDGKIIDVFNKNNKSISKLGFHI